MYKITEEEINKILLDSPLSLPNSPAEKGMKAEIIKSFFYKFIRTMAKVINEHFDTVYADVVRQIATHDVAQGAHRDILEKITVLQNKDAAKDDVLEALKSMDSEIKSDITSEIGQHNNSENTHSDMRELISNAQSKADNAYNLASSKSKVYPFGSIKDLVESWNTVEYNVGDVFITIEANIPDFTLISKEGQMCDEDKLFKYEEYSDISFEAGKTYYFEDKKMRIGATDGGYDHSKLVLKSEFEKLNAIVGAKENARTIISTIAESVTLENSTEYNLGTLSNLSIYLPKNIGDDFYTIVNFHSGGSPTSFDSPDEIVFTQDDCVDGHLYPISNRLYEVNIKNVNGVLIAKVSGTDLEVIE